MSVRRRVAIYNLYWHTYGGGEQVSAAIAEALAPHHDVTLLGPTPIDLEASRRRLGADLSGCDFRRVVDDAEASEASADFDVFVNGTYRSHAVNRATAGFYYVHFPEPPFGAGRRVVHGISRGGLVTLGAIEKVARRLPDRLGGVQRGLRRRLIDTSWTASYRTFWANSRYTAGWIDKIWGAPSTVVYPPVRPMVPPGDKTHLIASVGRFFDPALGHSKKQLDLVGAFRSMVESGHADDWRLVLVGGAEPPSRDYVLAVRRAAAGLPCDVHVNAPRGIVEDSLSTAAIYWHASGFGEDPDKNPDRFEHFGISVVEAMAAGAVPIVHGAAGPAEIVRDGIDGIHWRTIAELVTATRGLMVDHERRRVMSESARRRAADFSTEVFAETILGELNGQET